MLASDGVKVPRFEAQIIRRECRLPPPAIHCPRLWMRPHANPCCLCAAGFLPFHCFVGKFATPPDFNAVDGAGRCSCPTPGVPFQTACPPLNCRRGGRRAETWRTWRRSCGAGGATSWWRTSRLPRCRHRPGAAPLLAAGLGSEGPGSAACPYALARTPCASARAPLAVFAPQAFALTPAPAFFAPQADGGIVFRPTHGLTSVRRARPPALHRLPRSRRPSRLSVALTHDLCVCAQGWGLRRHFRHRPDSSDGN